MSASDQPDQPPVSRRRDRGQLSQGPSGADVEPLGGADAVPATPDTTPADHGAEPLARPDVMGSANDVGAAPPVSAPVARRPPAIIVLVVAVAGVIWVVAANGPRWLLVVAAVIAVLAIAGLLLAGTRRRRDNTR